MDRSLDVSWMENLCLEISSGDGEVWRYVNYIHICMCVCLYVLCMYLTIR